MSPEVLKAEETHIRKALPSYLFRERKRLPYPKQISIHSTRAPNHRGLQGTSLLNHFSSEANNHGGWGSSADYYVGPYDVKNPYAKKDGPAIIIQLNPDPMRIFASWAAGYGKHGPQKEWGVSEVGISIEVAQARPVDPFTDDQYECIALIWRKVNAYLESNNQPQIPANEIKFWDQDIHASVPLGFSTHEGTANGKRLGKTDPGRMFDFDKLFAIMVEPAAKKPERSDTPADSQATTSTVETLSTTSVDSETVSVLEQVTRRVASLEDWQSRVRE